MEIIPTINCKDFNCLKRRLDISKEFGAGWVQIDISDGEFAGYETWNEPERFLEEIDLSNLNYYIEVHLMVVDVEKYLENWLEAGVNRVIIHIESKFDLEEVLGLCQKYGAELMLSVTPETDIEDLFEYLDKVKAVQILGVNPGPSGQFFQKDTFLRINTLLEKAPGVTIEVDGGVDDRIAKELKKRGVDIVASGSFIFDSPNPEKRYKILRRSVNSKI